MPVIIAILGALGIAYFLYMRAKTAREAAETLADAANDVRLAARRFGFRRKANLHPADAVDDPRLAAMGIVAAVAQMDRAWEREIAETMTVQAQSVFGVDLAEAEELTVFGRWLSDQSGTPDELVRRLAKRIAALSGPSALHDLERMIAAVTRPGRAPSERVQDALDTLRRILR
jgi:hypothetical protein